MNRRKFFKICGLSVMAPLAAPVIRREVIPKCYRGFDISITHTDSEAPEGTSWQKPERDRKYKYIYIANDSVHTGRFFDSNKSDTEIWAEVKPAVDKAIDRYNNGHGA